MSSERHAVAVILAALLFLAVPMCAAANTFTVCNGEAPLWATPGFGEERIGTIPLQEPVTVLYDYDFWTKVRYKGTEGWTSSSSLCPPGGFNKYDLQFMHNRTETVKGKYRHFFGIFNPGASNFSGKIRLSMYNGTRVIFSEVYDFSIRQVAPVFGRPFHVETEEEMTGYWFEVLGE
jgi:hypothetical protein